MKYKVIFFISIFIGNTCLNGFLAQTSHRLAPFNAGFISSIAATLFKNSKSSHFSMSFKASKEEELMDFIKHYQEPNESFNQTKDRMMTIIQQKKGSYPHFPISQINSTALLNNLYGKNIDLEDMQQAFNFLKQKMKIPDEVNLHFRDHPNIPTSYNAFDRNVYLNRQGLCKSPAIQIFDFIHEFTHVKQHQEFGLFPFTMKSSRSRESAILEHEADTKAAEYIKCPMCLKVVIARALPLGQKPKELGYLTSDDLKQHFKQKSFKDLCRAHQSVKNSNTWSDLVNQQEPERIQADDDTIGSMLNRLL